MSPVEWPLAAEAADRQVPRPRLRAGRDRLRAARADFFLDDQVRLNDEERALMGGMLRQLVTDIADELLGALPTMVAARADEARSELFSRLRTSGLLDRDGVVALLLRRADEQRLRGPSLADARDMAAEMVGDEAETVAEAAMALTIARGRRRDRFGRLGVEYDDLAAEDAVALTYAVSAAVREKLGDEHDVEILEAARSVLSRHDEGRRLEAAVAAFVLALTGSGKDSDQLIRRAAEHRDAFLVAALLARQAGVDAVDGWNLFVGGEAMILARIAQCPRSTAAQLLATFDSQLATGSLDQAIELFDQTDDDTAEAYRRALRVDPHYRQALEWLDARG